MCQNTGINLEKKTLTIDENQLINVDKGLRNEKLQRKEISELKNILKKKDSLISVLNKKNEEILSKILELSDSISKNQNDINAATETQLDTEKKKRKNGMYAFSSFSGNRNGFLANYIGLKYVSDKMVYSFSFDLYTEKNIVFNGGIGFKIF